RGALRRVRVGRVVAVQAASLPDGTFAASKIRPLGRAGRAHFQATVAAVKGATLAISAGGSVFALRVRGKAGSATGGGFRPGDRIVANALVKRGSLQARREALKKIGHDDQLELEGIYLATADDGTIEMAVLHRGRVLISVPDDVMVPDFEPGDEIVAVVTVAQDGSFTLVKAENESSGGDDEGGGVYGDGTFTVVGVVKSLSVDRIFVKTGADDPVTCAIPDEVDVSDFEVGNAVIMYCVKVDDVWTLHAIKHKEDPPPPPDYVLANGSIDTLTAAEITVTTDDGPVTCAIPEGADLSAF